MPPRLLRLILLGAPLAACALSACTSMGPTPVPRPPQPVASSGAARPAAVAAARSSNGSALTTTAQPLTQTTVVATPTTAPINPIKPAPAGAKPADAAAVKMPAVRLLLPRNPGDPTLMIDENGIARALPSQSKAADAKTAMPATSPAAAKPPVADARAAALPSKPASPDLASAPPAATAKAAAAARAVSDTKPATAPSAAAPATTATTPTAANTAARPPAAPAATPQARLGDIPDDERRRLTAMPLPQLPNLAPREPAEVAASPAPMAVAAAPQPAAAGSGPGAGETATFTVEYAKANDRIGLGDAQLQRIAAAKALAEAGKDSAAIAALISVNHELDEAYASYTVRHGEGMRQIAARPEVYGNANLWPLIRDANRATLPDPRRLAEGQKLRVPRYPSAAAASLAIEQARAATP